MTYPCSRPLKRCSKFLNTSKLTKPPSAGDASEKPASSLNKAARIASLASFGAAASRVCRTVFLLTLPQEAQSSSQHPVLLSSPVERMCHTPDLLINLTRNFCSVRNLLRKTTLGNSAFAATNSFGIKLTKSHIRPKEC